MKKITCTIKELFDAVEELQNDKIKFNEFTSIKEKNIYIKDENNEFVKINSLLLKNGIRYEFIFEDNSKIVCSHEHKFCTNKKTGEYKLAKDLKLQDTVETLTTPIKIISIENKEIEDTFFDIEVDSNSQLYSTSNGIIHHNCGKSEMIQNIANYVGAKSIRINMHSGISSGDLIGRMLVKSGLEGSETVFKYGYIPIAMMNGWWVILDEIDSAEPSVLFRLQSVLEGGNLVVTENEGEIIIPHENFRIFATANTKGRGDELNSYTGTNFLNASFLDRYSIFEMTYSDKEKDIVNSILNDEILSEKLVQSFTLFRKASEEGTIENATFSTRRIISVARAIAAGDSLKEAFEFEVFQRYSKDEQSILIELLKDVFDQQHYLSKKWYLGSNHIEETEDYKTRIQNQINQQEKSEEMILS